MTLRRTRRTRLRGVTGAAIGLALIATAGCSATGDGTEPSSPGRNGGQLPSSLTGQRLHWGACPAPDPSQGGGSAPDGSWQCSTLTVPLDYAKPEGETIGIALIRARAAEGSRRLGSLIFNFGGPGGSGVVGLPESADRFDKLRARYDLVSFDPRGVGRSEGITCLGDADLDRYYATDFTPDDAAERARADAAEKEYIDACRKKSSSILPHVDTESVARDVDLMREVLGDSRTAFFGFSYGTQLGAVYAHLFPDRVGRFVLDGAVDPTQDRVQSALAQTKGFQLALDNYMKDCARRVEQCPTGRGGSEGNGILAALLEELEEKPLPTAEGRVLTAGLAHAGIASALYTEEAWEYLTEGLRQALSEQRGDILLALADIHLERGEDGRYSSLHASHRSVTCADFAERPGKEDVARLLPEFRKASPVFGEYAAWGLTGCSGWPVAGKSLKPEVAAPGAAPVLVIGVTGDPATPYAGARNLARALGDSVGVDVSLAGEGHGAYFAGSHCLTGLVDDYLLNGEVPERGTACA
ncbi:alpha/beta fold hydrolase [Streptomyces sp. MUM 203J]|uniref:alpha/beta hydrolase n=1 Tax=Streptomyces sp. MUM 203J TaxID=2791990 RepID=UPI001F0366BA|nr:alpha/beta hydrolase [Streptomyces sp. MUM 203J]MCH0540361.1 alpha/beta fold hydrolase [Streptomyces sp. MUM 203J]